MKKRTREQNKYATFWKSRAFVVLLMVVVVFISISVVQELIRRVNTQYDIAQLEEEVARLESRNSQISDVIALLNTSTTAEKEARVKLNHQQPGENVVMFPERRQDNEIVLPDSDHIDYILINDYQSNPSKWFDFFWEKMTNTS